MKRSEINASIKYSINMLEENSLRLPPFAYWSIKEWREQIEKIDNIKKIGLGWDVTDFGSGNFDEKGAVLFTIRNGSLKDKKAGTPYAEKLIFMQQANEQEIPLHYHSIKTEDIINRGGGILMLELFNSTPDGELDKQNPVVVKMDGITHTFEAGATVEVEKGCSITLQPRLYHRFWAKKDFGDLVVGEISSINDDTTDNNFYVKAPRFAQIEEDEQACYPLCNEYELLIK